MTDQPNGVRRSTAVLPKVILVAIPIGVLVLNLVWDIHLVYHRDQVYFTHTKLTIIREALLQGNFPFWNPYEGCGMVLFAQGALPVIESIGLFLLQPEAFMAVTVAVHQLLAMVFFFLFARRLGISAEGAVLGSVVWAFNGYHNFYAHDLAILGSNLWIPLVLYCYLRFTSMKKSLELWVIVAGIAIGGQLLAGRPTDFLYGLGAVFFVCLYHTMSTRMAQPSMVRAITRTGIFLFGMLVVGSLLSAFFLLPNLDHLLSSSRVISGGYTYERTHYVMPGSLINFFIPGAAPALGKLLHPWLSSFVPGKWVLAFFSSSFNYVGLALLPFLLYSWKVDSWYRNCFYILGLVALLLILPLGAFDIIRYLPLQRGSVEALRFIPVLMLSIAVLAGAGYDMCFHGHQYIAGSKEFLAGKTAPYLLYTFLVGLFLLVLLFTANRIWPFLEIPNVISAISLVAIGLLFLAAKNMLKRQIAFTILILSLMVCYFVDNQWQISVRGDTGIGKDYFLKEPAFDVVKYITQENPGHDHRVINVDNDNEVFHATFWQRFFVQSVNFYAPAPPALQDSFFRELLREKVAARIRPLQNFDSPFYSLANVKYIVGKDSDLSRLNSSKYPRVARDNALGVSVVINRDSFPRVFFVDRYKVIHDDKEALRTMREIGSKDINWFRENVILAEQPRGVWSFADASKAKILDINYAANRITITCIAQEPAIMVFLDSFERNWRALVDGRKAQLIRANYLFRAVPITPGEHVVVFEYFSETFLIGLIISVIAGLGVAVPLLRFANNKRKPLKAICNNRNKGNKR